MARTIEEIVGVTKPEDSERPADRAPERPKEEQDAIPPGIAKIAEEGRVLQPEGEEAQQKEPGFGRMATGLGADVVISSSGERIARTLPPAARLITTFLSGAAGDYVSQRVEGQENLSFGRMLVSGFANFMKANLASEGGMLRRTATEAGRQAQRGAGLGISTATAEALIDEGRLPTRKELADRGFLGAGFGAAFGTSIGAGQGLLNKVSGKTADEIDSDVATGKIKPEEVEDFGANAGIPRGQMRGVVAGTAANKTTEQAAQVTATVSKLPAVANIKNFLGQFVPTLNLSAPVTKVIRDFESQEKAAVDKAARIGRRIGTFAKANPELTPAIEKALSGGDIDPSIAKIEGDLLAYRETLRRFQEELLSQVESGAARNLSPERQEELAGILRRSIQEGDYTTRQYKLFTDPKYTPNQKDRDAAVEEIAVGLLKEGRFKTRQEALQAAEKHIADLEARSARAYNEGTSNFWGQTMDGVLKKRKDPGPAERKFLGEITGQGERAQATLASVARVTIRNRSDELLVQELLKSGIAVRGNRPNENYTELGLRTTVRGGTDIYVPKYVQTSISELYLKGSQKQIEDKTLRGINNVFRTAVVGSKASKVIFNAVSYPVQVWGNISTMLANGSLPTNPRDLGKGMKMALSEFETNEGVFGINPTSGLYTRAALKFSPKGRKQFLDDLELYKSLGIFPSNVVAQDIVNFTETKGFLPKMTKFLTESGGKAYSTPDSMFRYVYAKSLERQFRSLYPNEPMGKIREMAAYVAADTYQNYDRLNKSVRTLSNYGIALNPFVSFTFEVMRNQYNSAKYSLQMMRGTFGEQFGVTTAPNRAKMAAVGAGRLAAQSSVLWGSYAVFEQSNRDRGITEENERRLAETFTPSYDSNKQLLYQPDFKNRRLVYSNPSYMVPQATLGNILDKTVSNFDTPERILPDIGNYLFEEMIGTNFLYQVAGQVISGKDEYGRPITLEPEAIPAIAETTSYTAQYLFEPGTINEIEKWRDAIDPNVSGRYDVNDLIGRAVGIRNYTIDLEEQAIFSIRGGSVLQGRTPGSELAKNAKGNYTSILNNDRSTQEEIDQAYEKNNRIRKQALENVRIHYDNILNLVDEEGNSVFSQQETIDILKEAGVGTRDILSMVDGTSFVDMRRTARKTTGEQYDDYFEGMGEDQIRTELRELSKDSPQLARDFAEEYRRRAKAEARDLTPREKLIANLPSVEEKASYILSNYPQNRSAWRELVRKGVITRSVMETIMLKTKR